MRHIARRAGGDAPHEARQRTLWEIVRLDLVLNCEFCHRRRHPPMSTDVSLNQAWIGEAPQTEFSLITHAADVNDREVSRLKR